MSGGSPFDPLNPPAPTSPSQVRRGLSPLGCIAIAFGFLFLFLLMIALGIVGIFAFSKSVKKSEQARRDIAPWQLPPGKSLDISVKRSIAAPGSFSPDDTAVLEIQELFNEAARTGELPSDLERFILAVEQSTAAEIDWPTRLLLKHQITLESISAHWYWNNELLHIEWLKPNQEARAFVLTQSEYADRSIFAIWLVRKDRKSVV